MRKLQSIEEITEKIKAGKFLSLAGDERALSKLPPGKWIGGTIPYFMHDEKGEFNQEMIYATEIDSCALDCKIIAYNDVNISQITKDRFPNGYTILILPAGQEVQLNYGLNASDFEGIYDAPIVGWVSGIDLNSQDSPKTYNGLTGNSSETDGVAMHISLPSNKIASANIVNIHQENPNSDVLEFLSNDFSAGNCLVNGVERNFAEYLTTEEIDIKSPIISDYSGAKVNVAFKEVNNETGTVDFYGAVFKGRKYRFAQPINDYASEFAASVPALKSNEEFACNCILNYLYGEFESKSVGMAGPITFGEIAYILFAQTLVYLVIDDVD